MVNMLHLKILVLGRSKSCTSRKKVGWFCKCLCHKCVSEEEVQAVHESQRWIQQTFGFHCVRIEMLKNDFSPLIMIRVDFVFCISYASKQDRITALPPCKEVSFGAIINPIFCLIPVEAVYVFFLDAR
ncbi:PREDICTED: U4/U6.U5 small nuclear ribonucleoprotein 27 kDa protein isoform X3 [Myotis davidii]|uniref:U4/U6.U5 small nuclear ribonucleoprotein 27 kDa protein isoform X3 n=1 Tax=Myotis davidii TaxID=225400 RepID=UPI0007672614|nr:PREDICTED: U4/U6.U5 small nuclear ribonucleoprotein 27 kDa protein isoform X3 [Myotis davidii]